MQDHGDDDYGDGDDGGVVCTCVNRCRRKYHLCVPSLHLDVSSSQLHIFTVGIIIIVITNIICLNPIWMQMVDSSGIWCQGTKLYCIRRCQLIIMTAILREMMDMVMMLTMIMGMSICGGGEGAIV